MRTDFIRSCLLMLLAILSAPPARVQAAPENAPDFDEVRELVRLHLAGTSDTDLDRASVEGLLASLHGKVRLVNTNDVASLRTNSSSIIKAQVMDGHVAYLRIGQVAPSLPGDITRQCASLAATNKLNGLVLDLRFAEGDDYAAAAATADLFIASEKPLLDWGNGTVKSSEKDNALSWPVVVLVNAETAGAAEALAAVLREAGVALILGGTTRGAAMTTQDFALKNGQHLRIATSPVKLGDGTPISTSGIKPDITVAVTPDAERAFLIDPYGMATRTNLNVASTSSVTTTNRITRRTRPNEADLVRARRDGLSLDGDFPVGRDPEPELLIIRDPALARAVDLLKGLAIVRRTRP